jgi:restriction system protein
MPGATRPLAIGAPPPLPTYAAIGIVVRVLDGEPIKRVRHLMHSIFDQAGSASCDWSEPERWIDERLSGELSALARKVWEGSGKAINPRYLYDHFTFISRLRLLEPRDGIYRMGERGERFLSGDEAILHDLVALRSSKRRSKA